jgi:sulfide:quinone oxidoreductase
MKILIIGGGMGGTILANNLARRLTSELKSGKARITMITASDKHMYQPGLLYLAFGRVTPDELYKDQASLLEPGITLVVDPVEEFLLDANRVKTKGGKTFDYDVLAIATGSRPVPELIPGLAEHSETFYTEETALKMFRTLQAFQGGKVVIAVGVPHKCPMAPLEIAFMLHDYFKDRGIRDKVAMHYTYPIGRVHSLENVAKWAAPEFERLGITYETLFNVKEIDGKAKVVKSEEGGETPFDLLISIPAHRGMEVIEKNKLGAGGWIPTNRAHLNMEGRKNVFVLGDTTNIPISKAGSTAHFEAEALGENIAAMVKLGSPVREYDGKVF